MGCINKFPDIYIRISIIQVEKVVTPRGKFLKACVVVIRIISESIVHFCNRVDGGCVKDPFSDSKHHIRINLPTSILINWVRMKNTPSHGNRSPPTKFGDPETKSIG